jgi:hypothetical protein
MNCGSVAGIASPAIIPNLSGYYSPGIILLKQDRSPSKWRHVEPRIILLCVGWYRRYQLSNRDIEGMMRERGMTVEKVKWK